MGTWYGSYSKDGAVMADRMMAWIAGLWDRAVSLVQSSVDRGDDDWPDGMGLGV